MQHKICSILTRSTLVVMIVMSLIPCRSQAEPGREFLMSCAYGTLAGTLVGAASLAFTNKPGENLNNIARGASLGLYGGILLGLYVVYGVPSEEEQAIERQTRPTTMRTPIKKQNVREPKMWITPVFSSPTQVSGAVAHWNAWRF